MTDALGLRPVALAANQPPRFYRGGEAIAGLRGGPEPHREFGPEDWVASCTTLHGQRETGLSTLPGGTLLRDAVGAHPDNWLGAAHRSSLGADPALLVKLLDAGQRLPVHCHPSNSLAASLFNSRYGKTEAWIVIGTSGADPTVHIGFQEDVPVAAVADWVRDQDSAAMLSALNPVPVQPGDTVFVPAGVPHAIGAGVFIVELQQPTDLSVTLEWKGFLDDEANAHLGIGFPTALDCVDRNGWRDRLDRLVRHERRPSTAVTDLFAGNGPEFFRAQRAFAGAELSPSFAVLVVLDGQGALHTAAGTTVPLRRGDTLVVPHAAGDARLSGDVEVIRCLPPAL